MVLRMQEVITGVRMGHTGHTEQEKKLEQMSETELSIGEIMITYEHVTERI